MSDWKLSFFRVVILVFIRAVSEIFDPINLVYYAATIRVAEFPTPVHSGIGIARNKYYNLKGFPPASTSHELWEQ